MSNLVSLPTATLKKALALREKIDSLEAELAALIGVTAPRGGGAPKAAASAGRKRRRKPNISAEGRARIAAAQKQRWAKIKAAKAAAAATPGKPGRTAAR